MQRYRPQIDRKARRPLLQAAGGHRCIGTALDTIYRSPQARRAVLALHLAGWVAVRRSEWIGFRLIGVQIDLCSVIAIESLVYAAQSAAVFVPNALGVQEAAYAMLAPLFGVSAEFALAVSLLKRARDIAVGVPVLLIWQKTEGSRSLGLAGRSNPAPPAEDDACSRKDGVGS